MRIQFYSLNLGRHLHQKEEALCFVLVGVPAADYEGGRRCLFGWQKDFHYLSRQIESLSIITSSQASGCAVFCLSLHLLITLCSDQRAASKSAQERGAKGGSSLFLPLSRSSFPDTSSNSLGELSAERSDACPGQAVPSSPLLLLYFAKTAFRRRRRREELEWSGLLRPQRKEAPFHPLAVFVRLSLHGGPEHRARRPLLPIFKYVNNKKNMDLRGGWIWIFCLVLAGWKVTSYVLVNAFIRHECIGVYVFSLIFHFGTTVSSTPSSSKHQMEPVSVSVKDEPNVWVTGSFGTWSHQTHNSSEASDWLC